MKESMGLAHQAGAAVILVALTLWLQCAGMGVLIHWTRTFIERSAKKLSPWHSAVLMTSSGYVEIPVSLKSILKGQENDREMQAEDILYIPNNAGKSILYRGVPGLVDAATSAAIYRAY